MGSGSSKAERKQKGSDGDRSGRKSRPSGKHKTRKDGRSQAGESTPLLSERASTHQPEVEPEFKIVFRFALPLSETAAKPRLDSIRAAFTLVDIRDIDHKLERWVQHQRELGTDYAIVPFQTRIKGKQARDAYVRRFLAVLQARMNSWKWATHKQWSLEQEYLFIPKEATSSVCQRLVTDVWSTPSMVKEFRSLGPALSRPGSVRSQ